jgi:hypothetical protein
MNARRYLHHLFLVLALLLAPRLASGQVPALWSRCHEVASQVFPMYSWRSVEEVLAKASRQEVVEFVTWTPEPSVISGDNEDTFLFIWTRLDDTGKANIRDLETKKLSWGDTVAPGLIKLKTTQSHELLLILFRSVPSNNDPDPFDVGVIRCMGLVPIQYIDETIAELRGYCHDTDPKMTKYCDPSSKKPEATGIYGEEMLEIQDMLQYRKTEAAGLHPRTN